MATASKAHDHNYDEDKIKSLSSLEHIRKRSGMYIGRVGDGTDYDDGIYILLKEVVDNAIDEFIMGYGDRVLVRLEGTRVTVRDYGRGIPLGKVVECVSRINTGAKYSDEVFQFSVGLNGIGTKAVNALSSHFEVRSHRGGEFVSATFRRGKLLGEDKGVATEPDGTFVCFEPDPEIFGKVAFAEEHVERRLKLYSFLNAGLKIDYNGKLFLSRNGLTDLLREEASDEMIYPPLQFQSKTLEFAFSHTQRFEETFLSFVNGQYTSDGGTHLSAFREGLLKGFNEFAKGKFDGDDIREGMAGAIAVRLKEPVFESQTKNKLGNTELRSELVGKVREMTVDLLHRNPKAAESALAKIQETVKLRKELLSIKKMARERARATSIRVPQLKDCKVHFSRRNGSGEKSMLFITEGLSAAGSIVSCRDVGTQAVFTMRGKPLNVCDLQRDVMYKNEELYNLMRSLDIEDSLERLRYGKVILATDADVDGLHIRNLLLTFFLRFFEPIVHDGFVHILETPLFRVRNAKKTTYCYSEGERDEAVKETRGAEITRFKGLGEISPSEFKHFIGPEMRLSPVRLDNRRAVPSILGFYMGRNTPERRQYIMNHLVVDAES
ncbi:MAG: type IIA DNA topoisomerase subunit B [Acidobacteriota bacterium]|jgi:DNA gyrase subunit B/topoisomerase-4 subunit B|nr:type IIA DNA topoisomerase subunit B [Acidobacteriota bacterium]